MKQFFTSLADASRLEKIGAVGVGTVKGICLETDGGMLRQDALEAEHDRRKRRLGVEDRPPPEIEKHCAAMSLSQQTLYRMHGQLNVEFSRKSGQLPPDFLENCQSLHCKGLIFAESAQTIDLALFPGGKGTPETVKEIKRRLV